MAQTKKSQSREERILAYRDLILSGSTRAAAREAVGIGSSAERGYRRELRNRGETGFERQMRGEVRSHLEDDRADRVARYAELIRRGVSRSGARDELNIGESAENSYRRELGMKNPDGGVLFNQFAALVESGVDVETARIRVGVTKRSALRYRKKLRMPIGPASVPYPQEVRDKALEMLQEGMSSREVAKTLGLSETRVGKWYPDYTWTTQQSTEYANMVKKLNRIEGLDGVKKLN